MRIMKVLIVYHSEHHGNTKKLVEAIAGQEDVTLLNASVNSNLNWSDYDLIGFASGIYYQKFHKDILDSAERNLPIGKKVFFLYTCGVKRNSYTDAIRQITETRKAQIVGSYGCLGFDTFGPFKLVGGIAKGHPDDKDISDALNFFVKFYNMV